MIPLTLAQVAEITGGQLRGEPGAVVTGDVVIDSRRAGPGGLFAAVAGERADGHDFAAAAVACGAVAVLATRPVPVSSVLVADVPAALAALARFVVSAFTGVQLLSEVLSARQDLGQRVEEMWDILLPSLVPARKLPYFRSVSATGTLSQHNGEFVSGR